VEIDLVNQPETAHSSSRDGASHTLRAGLTPYHVCYFAHELTKRSASGSIDRLAGALADAQVDLNPHQVDAALFALSNPLSRGVILADEVGLGKTIEAGLLLSQRWAERQRRLLVIVPANLRKQWAQEMADKFHLPSVILESKSFNQAIKSGNLNPFEQPVLIICSYHFARSKDVYVKQTRWDLIVLDEAHRLRNVYKPSSRIAQSIKSAIEPYSKVLLTATPLQNSLLELFGLVSIVDEFVFGDVKSFRSQFVRPDEHEFIRLKERLNTVCKRTLRRQVLEYVKYTNRHALVQEFVPFEEEERLYELVSAYLQQPTLYALPPSQRQMMTLILRKLIASSTYAISGTLDGLVRKLEALAPTAEPSRSEDVSVLPDDENDLLDELDELEEEWSDDETEGRAVSLAPPTEEQLSEIRAETERLRGFANLARSIVKNSKGEVLLTALRRGFDAAQKAQSQNGASALQQKAIIFTESRRTQDYLFRVLQTTEFKDKIVLFNGTNADDLSKTIYRRWVERHANTDRISGSPSADMRAALVECFRDDAAIMIATEAAAEGVNLQFCNLVVNYDLPWNPQRIEQRIGRCHRYGQKHDVVVVNFLNKQNAADVRVYELLDEKFKLFNGVFGASDEVLGAIESGVDFEKRIATIYQKCRTPQQIEFEFNQLRTELETEIAGVQDAAREKLLDNFDQEVVEKVRIESRAALDHFNRRLWEVTRFLLAEHADFDNEKFAFTLRDNPFPTELIHPGPYRLGKGVEDANIYRVGHPLAQRLLESAKELVMPVAEVTFDLTGSGKRISILEPLRGSSGWLAVHRLKVQALEIEEEIIFAAITDHGARLDTEQCRRLFDLDALVGASMTPAAREAATLRDAVEHERRTITDEMTRRDGTWFDSQIDKMEHWAEDLRATLKAELDDAEDALKAARRAARTAPTLPEKLELQREIRRLETKRDDAWRDFDRSGRDLDLKKESLLDDIAKRLGQETDEHQLFTVRWHLA
jgi:ERCC4-related helicase